MGNPTAGIHIKLDAWKNGIAAMKVILSVESVRYPLTGIGRYVYELATHLLAMAEDLESLEFFGMHGRVAQISRPSEQNNLTHGLKLWTQKSALASELYRYGSKLVKRYALRGKSDFIYHGPNFMLPHFDGPKVATFHDLSPFTWAHCFSPERASYLQKELRYTLQSADRLITDSVYVKKEIEATFGWSADRIHVAPLASGPEFRPRSKLELSKILRKHKLTAENYSLFVGTIEPRKNILGLLNAYSQLPTPIRSRYPLVLTGYKGWESGSIHERIRDAEAEGWAKYLGYISTQELPFLFAGARLFVFPSYYEGFGLPVLEAMSSGVPVVCSNSSSLNEIAGDVALTSNPDDTETLASNILVGLTDEYWRKNSVQKGLRRSSTYTWPRCVEETLQVYRQLAV